MTVTEADVIEAMRDVVDPELGINVVDLGLLYGVAVDESGAATLDMTLTSAACPLTDVKVLDRASAMPKVRRIMVLQCTRFPLATDHE